LETYAHAETIGCYVSVKNEVDTNGIIVDALSKGKRVSVPVTGPEGALNHVEIRSLDQLKPAQFGLLEPSHSNTDTICPGELDLVVVPGIAFDKSCNRIGFGAGYYDRYLEHVPASKVGLAYDFQILEEVPTESHDVPLDTVITQSGILNRSSGDNQ
jgi:5-formyltetrahydrofolate cyclo-ligase